MRTTAQPRENAVATHPRPLHPLGRGRPLEPAVRKPFEGAFGHDFAGVRVHADDEGARSAAAMGATAYAQGRDIAFAQGAYEPGTALGRRLISHELAHVVQYDRANASSNRPGLAQVADTVSPAERAADRASDAIAAGRPAPKLERFATGEAGAVHRQAAPSGGSGSGGAGSAEPSGDPLLVLQFPITPLNFQLPVSGPSSIFVVPPLGARSTSLDQAAQPNVAAGLNLVLHRSLSGIQLGFESGLFGQAGPTFSLNGSSLPTAGPAPGRATRYTGRNAQLYVQPALIVYTRPEHAARSIWAFGADQFAVIAQPGLGRTWSDVLGLTGNAYTVQGGPQWTYNLSSTWQLTGAVLGGYTWSRPDPVPAGSPGGPVGPSGNWFVGLAIGVQPVFNVAHYRRRPEPTETPGGHSPAPAPEHQTPEPTPDATPQPAPSTSTGTPDQSDQPPPPAPLPALPPLVEIFFHQDRPLAGQGAGAAGALTAEGVTNLAALRQTLHDDSTLKLQLIGSASREGAPEYNYDLGLRRAEWLAGVLGIGLDRLVDPAEDDLRSGCRHARTGIVSCGAESARETVDGRDRRVLVRWFR